VKPEPSDPPPITERDGAVLIQGVQALALMYRATLALIASRRHQFRRVFCGGRSTYVQQPWRVASELWPWFAAESRSGGK
jgi:hypothetical protein